ncbi:DNA-binding transcriptional regulator, MarR family [Chryseobacterium carnipullorum]|uniref:Transcriptional regulator SlyA n=6 Tax=Chryseobacterium TaxID=59732 RepID=A0A1M7DDR4_CHRCU|nr:DNA-binding transcriptional regulator, MarR family [Chryseobacterium carnipullorum]STC98980.1 transcriptional regulator SlyA [Chryseobacterium carnipullorum]
MGNTIRTKMMDNNREKIENVDLVLKQTWLAVSKMYTELAQEHDSTAVQALTLLKIDPKEGTRSTNLGPKMAIEPTSLTRIIKLLEDNGYIYKEKTTADKREVIIKLTDKGLNSRNMSKEVVVNFNKKVMEKIAPEKIETFKEVMSEIMKIANELLNNRK